VEIGAVIEAGAVNLTEILRVTPGLSSNGTERAPKSMEKRVSAPAEEFVDELEELMVMEDIITAWVPWRERESVALLEFPLFPLMTKGLGLAQNSDSVTTL
jgi:hypothetical protein